MKPRLSLAIVTGIILVVVSASVFSQSDRKKQLFSPSNEDRYLGKLSSNPYDSESIFNRYGVYGNAYSKARQALRNCFLSGNSSPIIIGEDGTYLGRLNGNKFDSESISNPYGTYGSEYSPSSVNNPFGRYGSRYSPHSSRNPYTTFQAPKIYSAESPNYSFGTDSDSTGSLLDLDPFDD